MKKVHYSKLKVGDMFINEYKDGRYWKVLKRVKYKCEYKLSCFYSYQSKKSDNTFI